MNGWMDVRSFVVLGLEAEKVGCRRNNLGVHGADTWLSRVELAWAGLGWAGLAGRLPSEVFVWFGLGWFGMVWDGGVGVCLVRSTYLKRRRNPQCAIGYRAHGLAELLGKKSEKWHCQLVFASGDQKKLFLGTRPRHQEA